MREVILQASASELLMPRAETSQFGVERLSWRASALVIGAASLAVWVVLFQGAKALLS